MQETKVISEKNIEPSFKNWVKEAFGENLDKIDVLSEFDPELNLTENKEHFIDDFSALFCKKYKEKLELKDIQEKAKADKEVQLNELRKEEKKLIDEWKKSKFEDIDIKSFDMPKHFITMVCRGVSNSVILVGGGGTGKTYMCVNVIKKEKSEFEYQNTYTTPLELYKLLYRHKDKGKIMILDDIDGLWNNEKCMAILKAALWETDGKRLVTMNTSDKVLSDIPKIFEYQGRIIILSNRINTKDEHISALISRSNYYELNFTYKEKLRIMKEIIKKDYKNTTIETRTKAFDMLKRNTDITTEDLNFRTLIKTYDLLLYDSKKAEKLLKSTLKTNEDLKMVMELMESGKPVDQQISEFALKTGKKRATYYRFKEQIKRMM